jgi:hypothetical protein
LQVVSNTIVVLTIMEPPMLVACAWDGTNNVNATLTVNAIVPPTGDALKHSVMQVRLLI